MGKGIVSWSTLEITETEALTSCEVSCRGDEENVMGINKWLANRCMYCTINTACIVLLTVPLCWT